MAEHAEHYDVLVAGGGSGGIGAAVAAARANLRVLLVEAAATIGGTAVNAGVSTWEMGVGGTGLPFEIYLRLRRIPDAAWIYCFGRHMLWQSGREGIRFPGGELLVWPEGRYLDTLRRYGAHSMRDAESFVRTHWHGIPFEPDTYCRIVTSMLAETGGCTLLLHTAVVSADVSEGRVHTVTLSDGRLISANTFIDATGDAILAQACGSKVTIGQEDRATFGEPDAPVASNRRLNGVSLIYRLTLRADPGIDPRPSHTPTSCWWHDGFPPAVYTHTPRGDIIVNPLPIMDGLEAFEMGTHTAYEESLRRVLAHWHHTQVIFPELQKYRLSWVAPALGIRESLRIVGRYVLTEHDLLLGINQQTHPDIVALSDHAMDTHRLVVKHGGCGELHEPYGVPFRCLLPQGIDNLLVACRAASFSSLAASSCRLSRTMMTLGQAAGTAAAIAQRLGINVASVPPSELRAELRAQHVQLDHPLSDDLHAYITQEESRVS